MSNSGVPLNPQLLAQLQQMQQGGAAPMQDASSAPPPAAAQSVQPDMNQAGDAGGMAGGQPTTQSPAGGQQTPQVDPRALIAQNIQRVQSLNPEADTARQQASTMQQPSWGPHITPGAGFLHNLGQVLTMAAEMTKPGQAVVQAAYRQPQAQYAARQAQLGKQISDVQSQQQLAQQGATSASELAYHQDLIGERARHDVQTEATGATRAQGYLQSVANRGVDIVNKYNLGKGTLDEKTRHDFATEAQAQANQAEADFRSLHRDATAEEVAQIGAGVKQNIANAAAAKDPSVKGWLFNMMSLGTPQTPGGADPTYRPTTNSPKPSAPQSRASAGKVVAKGTIVYDPQGKPHSSDGTHPLPKGWSTQKAN
jgi:hypothetical protein